MNQELSPEMRLFLKFANWAANLKPVTIHYLLYFILLADAIQILTMVWRSYMTVKGNGP